MNIITHLAAIHKHIGQFYPVLAIVLLEQQ
jgi:hypothetical protein